MIKRLFEQLSGTKWHRSEFSYEVVRTNRRKSATIKVNAGRVQIVVPKWLSEHELQRLIDRKSRWIREKLRSQAALPVLVPKQYVDGERFRYRGRAYALKVVEASVERGVKLQSGRFQVSLDGGVDHNERVQEVHRQLQQWYCNQAQRLLPDKTAHYAARMGVEPQQVVVKSYSARWGSCSSRGVVSYNWRVVMAPDAVIDYVVVHELAHLVQLNHSASFWRYVEQIIPDYRLHRDWLKTNGMLLTLE